METRNNNEIITYNQKDTADVSETYKKKRAGKFNTIMDILNAREAGGNSK